MHKTHRKSEISENQVGAPWVTFKNFKNLKMESMEDNGSAQTPNVSLNSWSHHTDLTYLRKCHYWWQNYKNATVGPQMLAHSLG